MMPELYTIRNSCRLCGGELRQLLELTPTPPANNLLSSLDEAANERTHPLILSECNTCGHAQSPVVVDPNVLFGHYLYTSATSPVFREHLSALARDVSRRLFPDDLIVEIGSNDGTLLERFERPLRVLGVDPARNLAEKTTAAGVLTYPGFMNAETAHAIVRAAGKARRVLALNVFAHADDLSGIASAVWGLLTDNGEFILEVAYLPDMLRDGTFDLLYGDHLAFWHLAPMAPFFQRHGLCLYDAERIPTQGGSIRCFVSKERRQPTDRLVALMAQEKALVTPEAFEQFRARIDSARAGLTELLASLKSQGKRIAAFGCPAKATTLLHAFGIGRETLDYIVEENPLKVGRFSPGKHIPIVSVEKFRADPPDCCVVLAWNFFDSIVSRHQWFTGTWIHPFGVTE